MTKRNQTTVFLPSISLNIKLQEWFKKIQNINSQENYIPFKNQRTLVKREIKVPNSINLNSFKNSVKKDGWKCFNLRKHKKQKTIN